MGFLSIFVSPLEIRVAVLTLRQFAMHPFLILIHRFIVWSVNNHVLSWIPPGPLLLCHFASNILFCYHSRFSADILPVSGARYDNSDDAHACQYTSIFLPRAPTYLDQRTGTIGRYSDVIHIFFVFGPYEGLVSCHIPSARGVAAGADSRVTSAAYDNSLITLSKIVPSWGSNRSGFNRPKHWLKTTHQENLTLGYIW